MNECGLDDVTSREKQDIQEPEASRGAANKLVRYRWRLTGGIISLLPDNRETVQDVKYCYCMTAQVRYVQRYQDRGRQLFGSSWLVRAILSSKS